ncbi:MAG: NAD(P)H-hydrate dehydratase, partial [Bacteroidota bacterium]
MKIFNASQVRELDKYTIENLPITSIDLMEKASNAFVDKYTDLYPINRPVYVVAGTGNNGGDGLAVARLLLEKGFEVQAFVIRSGNKSSDDFNVNRQRLTNLIPVKEITNARDLPQFPSTAVVIDALFGSGLSRPVEGLQAETIININKQGLEVVAIDIASGLMSDAPSQGEAIMQVQHTISFQLPKLAFFMAENEPFVGQWHIVDIGLLTDKIEQTATDFQMLQKNMLQDFLPKRRKHSHKGNFGRVLMIMGSKGKMGAAVLSARACLKTGCGLLTIHVPECGYSIMQTTLPEAMTLVDSNEAMFTEVPDLRKFDTLGIGPGLGTAEYTMDAYAKLLYQIENTPLVIDADGLNMLAKRRELLSLLPENTILTPHPKEFERIAGESNNSFDRINLQQEFARNHRVIVVLKGAYTTVATPQGSIYFNSTGNPGMATAGSGDVLTGIITSLLAQIKNAEKAAQLGIYIHGLAGDIAAREHGEE